LYFMPTLSSVLNVFQCISELSYFASFNKSLFGLS
jgi:hypothetical protein